MKQVSIGSGVLLCVLAIAFASTFVLGRMELWPAMLAAFAVCLLATVLSGVVSSAMSEPSLFTQRLLIASGIRAGLPLLACVWVIQQSDRLRELGFIEFIALFYFAGMVVEIAGLTVKSISTKS